MGLEAADQALEQALSSPEHSKDLEATSENQNEADSNNQDIPELEKLAKFKFGGEEITLEQLREWKSGHLRQSDYTSKTQELAEERKYYDNLNHDLKAVKSDPSLAEEFKKIYPERFHGYLDYIIQKQEANPQGQQQGQVPGVDQSFMKELDELKRFKQEFQSYQLEATEAKLEATFQKLSQKYDHADERTVTATAQAAIQQGIKLDEKTWEKIFKSDHERNQQRYQAFYEKQVKQQKEANTKARDSGVGGGVPGQAPKRMSIDEATELAIRDLTAARQ